MPFQLIPLPYPEDALEEFMSAETLWFHHGKHHKNYVDKVNAMVKGRSLEDATLVEVVRAAHDKRDVALFNNSAQLWNHNFFWRCLAPKGGPTPTGQLARLIEETFGSLDGLVSGLCDEATAHFSNGWTWLVLDGDSLRITSLHDADTPLVYPGMKPLLTLDIWEHAYYIDYRNRRGDFARQVLGNLIDWAFVAENLDGRGEVRADQQGTVESRAEVDAVAAELPA